MPSSFAANGIPDSVAGTRESQLRIRKTAIKICGVTRAEDIDHCEHLGVEYIGFNFVSDSPRCLTYERAFELRTHVRKAKLVGVFADASVETVKDIACDLSFDYVQLHGQEDATYVEFLQWPTIKAFRSVITVDQLTKSLSVADFILLDGSVNSKTADWDAIAALPDSLRSRLFLAGGLQAVNVAEAIQRIHPFAVDIASGVESSPGIKDPVRLQAFIHAVRSLRAIG